MAKVLIVSSFHRFVPNPESTESKPLKERREDFPAGKTVEVSEEDAADWKAKGLAEDAPQPAASAYRDVAAE